MGYKKFLLLFFIFWMVGCEAESTVVDMSASSVPQRQYDPKQLTLGGEVFQNHCASCHGSQAQGDANWRKKDADGFYPARIDGSVGSHIG